MRTLWSFELAVAFASYTFRSQSTLRRVHSISYSIQSVYYTPISTLHSGPIIMNRIIIQFTLRLRASGSGTQWAPSGYLVDIHIDLTRPHWLSKAKVALSIVVSITVSIAVCRLVCVSCRRSMQAYQWQNSKPTRSGWIPTLSYLTHTLIQPRTDFDSISK